MEHDEDFDVAAERARLERLFTVGDTVIDAGFDALPAAVWLDAATSTLKKVPLLPHGHLDAHRDRQLLRQQLIAPPHVPSSVPDSYVVVVGMVPGSGGCGCLDCDVKNGKVGDKTLRALVGEHGNFVGAAWQSPSGGVNVLFDKPNDASFGNTSPWEGIDVRADNGWVVAPGNKTAHGDWTWKSGGFDTTLPLPDAMVAELRPASGPGRYATSAETVTFIEATPLQSTYDAQRAFGEQLAEFRNAGTGSRHDAMARIVSWSVGMVALDMRWAVQQIKQEWDVLMASTGEVGRGDEVDEFLRWVVGREVDQRAAQVQASGNGSSSAPLIVDYQVNAAARATVVSGATFVLDTPIDLVARWGRGSDVLWAQGESLMICGPTGVGKTTIAGQLVAGLIEVIPDLLGYPILPASRVLYMAMDRPKQVRRAFGRLFNASHRRALTERLLVRPGPLPQDLANKPEALIELAQEHDADVLVIDSLKDAAVSVHDPTVGGQINRAIQWCNAAGVDVLVLHHQRKSQEGRKPSKLDDVYGGMPVTAGAGSVVLLWGEAGSELVELSHLKQPAEMVGPLSVEHDHHKGTSQVTRGWDALTWLRLQGKGGGTIADAAQAAFPGRTPTDADRKQIERRLRKLVAEGAATTTGQSVIGTPARFMAVLVATSPSAQNSQVPSPNRADSGNSDMGVHGTPTTVDEPF